MPEPNVVQQYFEGWNAHDAAAIVAAFAPGGTYADPATPGPLTGAAIGEYAARLWQAFPDVAFELRSQISSAEGLVAAEWVMTGTHRGALGELPPTGRRVTLTGADFIRIDDRGIRSVQGYFDMLKMMQELGVQAG